MLSLIPHENSQISRSAITPYFNYEKAVALRRMALKAGASLPRYLLAPEITVLLDYLPDLRQRLLFDTLWNTGARINECPVLTPGDFELDGAGPFVTLKTLKQRHRGPGRPENGEALKRIVPLSDPAYVRRLQEYAATMKITRRKPLWPMKSDDTARNWLKAAVQRAERDGVTFTIPITPHTFRHSFAMHLLQNGLPFKVLQAYMGHQDTKSTEIYTRIFALDVGHQYGVRFSMDTLDARALLLP